MRTKETEEEELEEEEEEEEGSHCGSLVEGGPATENWTGERKNSCYIFFCFSAPQLFGKLTCCRRERHREFLMK